MLGRYYYVNAILPSLEPGGRPPFSSDIFLPICRGHLSESDFESLRICRPWVNPFPVSGPPIWHRWLASERGLRARLAILRAEALGWDEAEFSRSAAADTSALTGEAVESAFAESNPQTAENCLFQERWRILDDLDRETFMALENLIIYHLKLQLLESRAELSEESGRQTLTDLRRIVETEMSGGDLTPDVPAS